MKAIFIVMVEPQDRGYQRFLHLLCSLRHFEKELIAASTLLVINDNNPLFRVHADNFGFESVELLKNPYEGSHYKVPAYDRIASGLLHCLRRASELNGFDFIIKVDTDALACGPFAHRIGRHLLANPKLGMIGTFRDDPDGKPRGSEEWWAKQMRRTCGILPLETLRFHRQYQIPVQVASFRRWIRRMWLLNQAVRRGWNMGDHVLGGACAFSPAAIKVLRDKGILEDVKLFEATRMSDDVAVCILLASMGYSLGGFNRAGEVFAIWYQKPTIPYSTLSARGYGFVHSIKSESLEEENQMRRDAANAFGIPLVL